MLRLRKPASPFRYFNSSSEVIRLVVMKNLRFPLILGNVEVLLFERVLISPMRRCAYGGASSARCSQPISATGGIAYEGVQALELASGRECAVKAATVRWKPSCALSSRCQTQSALPRLRRMLAAIAGPNFFAQLRTDSYVRSMPRSERRSSMSSRLSVKR